MKARTFALAGVGAFALAGTASAALIGQKLMDIDIPEGVLIALIRRDGEHLVPRGQTELRSGDRLTIVGDPQGIADVAARYGSSGGS